MCTITLSYNENDIVASEKLAALLATGLFIQQDASKELDIDYSDSSLYEENDLMPRIMGTVLMIHFLYFT